MAQHNFLEVVEFIKHRGDEVALSARDGRAACYAEVATQIEYVAAFFKKNFDPKPRVMTVLQDDPVVPVLVMGGCMAATILPANPAYTNTEIENLLEQADIDILLVDQASSRLKTLAQKHGISLVQLHIKDTDKLVGFDLKLMERGEAIPAHDQDDTVLILLTSGSTGSPKRVPITERALLTSAYNIIEALELDTQDQVVNMLPMFHIGAILDLFLVPLLSGGRVYFAHPISVENLVEAIQQSKATWFQAVPTMLKALTQVISKDELQALGPNLRFVRSVSADLAPALHQDMEEKLGKTPIVQMYGMTETAGQIASNPPDINLRKVGSVGKIRGPEVAILDRFGNHVDSGKGGEICIRGETVTKGYENSDATENFFGPWLRSGDLGYYDEDGYLFITGRVKDIINRGGEKISALEVEQAFYTLPKVAQVAVVSIAHSTLQEEVAAAVTFTENTAYDIDELRSHLSKYLAEFKLPKRIQILDDLPKLGSGKIDKTAIRELLAKGSTDQTNDAIEEVKERSAFGQKLATIWSQTLKTPLPKDEDDFFDAGGDSLLAQNFIFKLEELFKVTLPANVLYEAPTFGELE